MTEDHSTPSQGEQRREGEMIERVARAIDPTAFDDEENLRCGLNMDRMRLRKRKAMKAAQAAIEAMRDPTSEMFEAGDWQTPSFSDDDPERAVRVWQAMIDSALSTVQGDKT